MRRSSEGKDWKRTAGDKRAQVEVLGRTDMKAGNMLADLIEHLAKTREQAKN